MATLNDIAKACHVSKTTVSRVLNQDPEFSVSPETRKLIFDTAASMDYDIRRRRRTSNPWKNGSPERSAGLPNLKIGILNPELKSCDAKAADYYSTVFAGLMSGLQELYPASDMDFRYILKDSYEELTGLTVLILLGKIDLDPHHPLVSSIKYKIAVDYRSPENQFDSVCPDFYLVVKKALDYFHSIGHSDIGYIGGRDSITRFACGRKEEAFDLRQMAFRDYCLQNGIEPAKRIWLTDTFSPEEGYRMTDRLLKEHALPDAVLYGSDELALGSYKAFQEHGIQIGKDVSVIGIDDMPFSQFLNPPLTTVSLNAPLIGKSAAHALASQIFHGRDYPLTIHPPVELIVRESCREPK